MGVFNYEFMRQIEADYRKATGLNSRDHYSIFYGPISKSPVLFINANPGGRPDNYSIVDVYAGEHEYVEGVASGRTTANGAEIIAAVMGYNSPSEMRRAQVINRFFRRSAMRPDRNTEMLYMAEALPFVRDIIRFVEPKALVFGGDAGVRLLAEAHAANIREGEAIMGPNGSNMAVYYKEYDIELPYYRTIPAYGIYHPSKLNAYFRTSVLPVLKNRLRPLLPSNSMQE